MLKKLFFLVCFLNIFLHAKKIDFLEEDFETFVQRVIKDPEAQNQFKSYYTALTGSLQQFPDKRVTTERYFMRVALANLRTAHPDWYSAIEPYMTEEKNQNNNTEKVKVSMFLIRYGAYEEFKSLDATHQKAQVFAVKIKQPESGKIDEQQNYWQKVKSSVKSCATSVYNKMTDWFGKVHRSISVSA